MMQQRRSEFSPQLTTLRLALAMAVDENATPRWIQLERMMDAASHASTLTRLEVVLEVDGAFALIPLRTMRPLTRLRESLVELSICRYPNGEMIPPLSQEHIDLLRSLHRLESLTLRGVSNWPTHALEWLAEEPPMTRLQEMDLGVTTVSSAHSTVLARFTWLQHLAGRLGGNPAFLAHLTQLTSVTLDCELQVDPALLVSALAHCTRITRVIVTHSGITSVHLCALLPSLPLLDLLHLGSMTSLTSLSFASSVGHLARTLHVLAIFECSALSPEEARHLHALTTLRGLFLHDDFNAPLDDDIIASMSPTARTFAHDVWQHLTRFQYVRGTVKHVAWAL